MSKFFSPPTPKHNHITSDTPEQSQNRVMNRCTEHFKTSYIKHTQVHDCQLLRHLEINLIGNIILNILYS